MSQPEMREFIDAARALGWTLIGYEISYHDDALNWESTNRRELVQASNLVAAWRQIGEEPMLVWCGNGHHAKLSAPDWTPMGVRFTEHGGFEPYSIDQTATVSFAAGHRPNIELTDDQRRTLDGLGGTAGFVAADPPPGLAVPDYYDALILSTDNDMS